MIRFFVLFMVLLVGLFSLRITNAMRDLVTVPFTGVLADISAFLIKLFGSDVISYGVIYEPVDGLRWRSHGLRRNRAVSSCVGDHRLPENGSIARSDRVSFVANQGTNLCAHQPVLHRAGNQTA